MPNWAEQVTAIATAVGAIGLLSARHRDLDREGRPAYLEAASPLARDLYLRHGYALRPGAPFRLPGGGPPMWPMLREARAAG